jgi:hypothetical protein
MKLASDYRDILRKAWSIRLMLLAGLLTGCEAILPLYQESIPRGTFAVLSMLAITGGLIARIVAQRNMGDE